MEHLEELLDLIVLLLFLIFAPMLRRLQQGRKARRPARPAPQEPLPDDQASPRPPPPVQEPGSAPLDYRALLMAELRREREHLELALARVAETPLASLPRFESMATLLLGRIQQPLRTAVEAIDRVLSPLGEDRIQDPLEILSVMEQVRAQRARSRLFDGILASFSAQRLHSSLSPLLARLDQLGEALAPSTRKPGRIRRRSVLIWDGEPAVPSAVIGPGDIGVTVLPRRHLSRVSGWSQLALGLGFDLMAENPDLSGEVQRVARVGPLSERTVQQPYVASPSFDMAAAVACWVPHLAADLIGTQLLGPAYAAGLIHSEIQSGLIGSQAITVRTHDGLYHPEPPLAVRLTAIETQLRAGGWAQELDLVGDLARRTEMPQELRYSLPTYLVQRFPLKPILGLIRLVATTLAQTRFAALGQRYLTEVLVSELKTIEPAKVRTCRQQFLKRERPQGSAVLLLAGAILAQSEPAAIDMNLVIPLLDALATPSVEAPERARRLAGPVRDDRTLARDAFIFGEIFWQRSPVMRR